MWVAVCVGVVTWSPVAQSELQLQDVTTGLTVPWDLVWGPDNHIWCMEKTGRITRIHPDEGSVEEVYQIPGVYQSFDNSGAHAMMLHLACVRRAHATPPSGVHTQHTLHRGSSQPDGRQPAR